MADKKLFDNLFKVYKVNSGAISQNDVVATEILDLEIPRGYCARVRKVIFRLRDLDDQDNTNFMFKFYTALVADPDDDESVAIPTFDLDHDVVCDWRNEMWGELNTNGETSLWSLEREFNFDETLDVVTVRNMRHNSLVHGMTVGGSTPPQVECEVYFTYEKISLDLYSKLLGIS